MYLSYFFFHDPPPTDIYTLSLHDALPIYHADQRACELHRGEPTTGRRDGRSMGSPMSRKRAANVELQEARVGVPWRSEEHTSELQSLRHLVCRLLLEKKKKKNKYKE